MRNGSCAIALGALLATTTLSTPALAQSAPSAPPPLHNNVDANGVDLVTGKFRYSITEAVMGSGEGAVSLERFWGDDGFRTNWSGGLYTAPDGFVYAEFGGLADSFSCSGATCTSRTGNGATLVGNVYTARDGTQVEYQSLSENGYPLQGYDCPNGVQRGNCAIPISVIRPNGMKFTILWTIVEKCTVSAPDCEGGIGTGFYRFQGVSSAAGYSFNITYLTNSPGTGDAPQTDWYKKTGVTFANSVAACTSACPSLTYSTTGALTITDNIGRQWKPTGTSIQLPGDASPSVVAAISSGVVTSVTNHGVTTSYSRSVAGNVSTMTVTNALSHSKVVTGDIAKGRVTSVKDELNRTTSFQYDADGRLTRTTMPEGNYVELTYDARGNVTQSKAVSKTAGSPADIVTTASYPASCANPKTCNQPEWTRDARLKQTDYSYDANHGGLLTVTAPAPTSGGVRPQTRYGYTLTASPVAGQPGIYLPTSVSACQTLASCTNGADETRQDTTYAGNLLPQTVTARNGTDTLRAVQTMAYDPAGNLLTVDGPLADDTTTFRYDGGRRRVGTISPDPDGAGTLKRRAVRITYRPDSQVTLQEVGTVNGTSDTDWANFVTAYRSENQIDTNGRTFRQNMWSNNVYYSVIDYLYDGLGRLSCSVTKMDPNNWATQATSCQPMQLNGPYGPDRVAKTVYNQAGEVTEQHVAVGVAGQEAVEATFTYTSNGKLQTLKDAEGNLTSYFHDGFDRLSETRYPTKIPKGAGTSDANDNELLTYDANSNILSRQLRDNSSIAFAYDDLNRLISKDLPGSEPTITYGYDLLGRMTSASQPGHGLSFTWDALGRQLTETGPLGTVTNQWDLAGRRTHLSTTAGFTPSYQRLVTGEMKAILDAWGTTLASFTYDDLGRRTGLSRIYGTSTNYGYDPVSRLSSLSHDFNGSGNDVSWAFGYNPAGQIASSTRNNDAYAWSGHGAGSTASTANGLNQLASIGGGTPGYDQRGNLTSDPTTGKSFGYSSENQLTSASGGVALSYDPLGRLYQTSDGTTVRRFQYAIGESGLYEAIGEFDGSNGFRHFHAFGPGVDEPLMRWENGGLRMLHADERGSIVAESDSSGNAVAINRYDEFGKPQAGNVGRFQYTGQLWMPEAGLYHYKARAYAPHLGRFMQTDPAGGTNLYAYVGIDPIGASDPSGMFPERYGLGDSDDMSRSIDFTPQGSGWGSRSWDWMGQTAVFSMGFLDSQQISREYAELAFQQRHGVSRECYNSLACLNAAIAAGIADLSSPIGSNPLQFGPLSLGEQALMNQILASPRFDARSDYAWAQTLRTGNEHGFFIWVTSNSIVYGRVWEGNPRSMGREWSQYARFGAGDFWATFHTHPGSWRASAGPSAIYGVNGRLIWGDLYFNQIHGAIGIIRSRWGTVYGH